MRISRGLRLIWIFKDYCFIAKFFYDILYMVKKVDIFDI